MKEGHFTLIIAASLYVNAQPRAGGGHFVSQLVISLYEFIKVPWSTLGQHAHIHAGT